MGYGRQYASSKPSMRDVAREAMRREAQSHSRGVVANQDRRRAVNDAWYAEVEDAWRRKVQREAVEPNAVERVLVSLGGRAAVAVIVFAVVDAARVAAAAYARGAAAFRAECAVVLRSGGIVALIEVCVFGLVVLSGIRCCCGSGASKRPERPPPSTVSVAMEKHLVKMAKLVKRSSLREKTHSAAVADALAGASSTSPTTAAARRLGKKRPPPILQPEDRRESLLLDAHPESATPRVEEAVNHLKVVLGGEVLVRRKRGTQKIWKMAYLEIGCGTCCCVLLRVTISYYATTTLLPAPPPLHPPPPPCRPATDFISLHKTKSREKTYYSFETRTATATESHTSAALDGMVGLHIGSTASPRHRYGDTSPREGMLVLVSDREEYDAWMHAIHTARQVQLHRRASEEKEPLPPDDADAAKDAALLVAAPADEGYGPDDDTVDIPPDDGVDAASERQALAALKRELKPDLKAYDARFAPRPATEAAGQEGETANSTQRGRPNGGFQKFFNINRAFALPTTAATAEAATSRRRLDVTGNIRLLRFLRANKHSVTVAASKYRAMLAWRETSGIEAVRDTIVSEGLTPLTFPGREELLPVQPHNLDHKNDVDGHIVTLERTGMCDPRGLMEAIHASDGEQLLMRYVRQ